MKRVKRLFWWVIHIAYVHFPDDLSNIIRVDKFWWGEVPIRECPKCGRLFADFLPL